MGNKENIQELPFVGELSLQREDKNNPAHESYPGGSLFLDEHDEEGAWVHPTDVVMGMALLAKSGRDAEDSNYILRITESKKHGHSGLAAEHVRSKQLDFDCRRVASLIVGNTEEAKEYARKLLKAIAISRHGVLYRTAGQMSGHLRMDRSIAQVQQRYIKLNLGGLGGFTWSRELKLISGVPVLMPIISLSKLTPWRRVISLSQCEGSSNGFQTFVLFLLLLHNVNPGSVQFSPTSISCAWPPLDESMADEGRNVIRADTTVTCVTSSILQCHRDHTKVGSKKFHVRYVGLWGGDDFKSNCVDGRIGFKRVSGIDELNRKRLVEEDFKIPIMHVFHSWQDVAQVDRLKTVQEVYNILSQLDENVLRSIFGFYSNLWEPLDGLRLELSEEEVFVDLAVSVTAVMHSCGLKNMMRLVEEFIGLIGQDWVREAKDSKWFPCRMAAPYNPAVLLNKDRETYYTFGASFSWEEKSRVPRSGKEITIPGALSRVYKDGLVIGSLDGTVWSLNDAEMSLLENGEIGWITEFILEDSSYRVVEVDVISADMFETDPDFRVHVAEETQMKEPRIASVHRDDTDWVRKSLPISVMLLAAQLYVSKSPDPESLRSYDEVKEEIRGELDSEKLCSIDLAYFHLAMGSYGSRNKIWSARSLAEHKRLWSLLRNPKAPERVEWKESKVRSRLLYSDREAVFVRARRPWDTVAVLVVTLSAGVWILTDASRERDFYDLGTLLTAVLGTETGLTGLYHAIRYRAWALGDAVRAYRKCRTIEEMRSVMTLNEVHKTLLDAGESGRFTDGVRTCAYSDRDSGSFAVAQGLKAEIFEQCGGKLGLDSDGDDVMIYRSRIRKVEIREDGFAHVTSEPGTFPVVRATRLKGATMEGCSERGTEPCTGRRLRSLLIHR